MCYVIINFCCVYLVNVPTRWQKKKKQFKTKKKALYIGFKVFNANIKRQVTKIHPFIELVKLLFGPLNIRVHANI